MELASVILIAIALAMDAFTVSVATGLVLTKVNASHVFRMGFHFGLFQFLMPILGWFGGKSLESVMKNFDHWIAFLLLFAIGLKMIFDANKDEDERPNSDPTRGVKLVLLSIATSIDAFAVGLSLGLIDVPIFFPAVVIGITALLLSSAGILFGNKLGRVFRQRAEIIGGFILIIIGLRILAEHNAFEIFKGVF